MAIDYTTLLSPEERLSIVNARIKQFANEAYQHDLNRSLGVSTSNEELVKTSDAALVTLGAAIENLQTEVATLG